MYGRKTLRKKRGEIGLLEKPKPNLVPLSKQQLLGVLQDLTAFESINFIQVIDMSQDEVKIPCLTAFSKVVSTCPISNHIDRHTAPLLDNCTCPSILGLIASRDEDFRNPCTTQLILFAKFTAGPCANHSNYRMMSYQMCGYSFVVPQTRNVHCLRLMSCTDDLRPAGRKEEHWPMNI